MKAQIRARIVADSITEGGSRLTTQEWTYPRMIHAEIMTHGALRRNSASSRAIPTAKFRRRVLDAPVVPIHWGLNQAGMQAHKEIDDITIAENWWRKGLAAAAELHAEGEAIGLHKQIVNRVLEPWMPITIVVTATDWANMYHQRMHKDAEPHFQALARASWEAFTDSLPAEVEKGGWHMPFLFSEDLADYETLVDREVSPAEFLEVQKKISTGRCARTSYLTHDGRRDIQDDLNLHDKLLGTIEGGDPGHLTPFEHVAQAVGGRTRIGPLEGWKSYRKFFPNEAGPDTTNRCERCGLWAGQHVRKCPLAV